MFNKKFINLTIVISLIFGISFLGANVSAQSKRDEKRAEKLVKDGNNLFNRRDYRGSINKYAEAISLVPSLSVAHYWKGYAHYYLKEYDLALSELDTAFNQGYSPDDIYKVRWFVNYQKGNYDAALSDAQKVLQTSPNEINILAAVGDIYRGKGDYTNALAAYKKVAERNPQNGGDIAYLIAEANYNLGNTTDQGIAAADAVKKNTQYNGEAWFLIADALQKNRQTEQAIDAYERSISGNRKIINSYNNLAELYRSRGMYRKAVETMQKGLKEFPTDGTLYGNMSWYYSLAEEGPEALAAGQKAVEFAPDQYMGYTNLCRAYNDMKLYQQAIKTCNDALKMQPGDGETNLYLGLAYDRLKQTAAAKDYFKKAITGLNEFTRNNPDYSDGFYLLGNAYFYSGDDKSAIEAYRKTIELSPRFARARFNLGAIYFLGGKKDLAQEQYNALKEIDTKIAAELYEIINK
jgi:tetratricopeptide (TPR) repeat protein